MGLVGDIRTRRATSVCQFRHGSDGAGPTEPHAGRSTFLLSSGGVGVRYCWVAVGTGWIATEIQFPFLTLVARVVCRDLDFFWTALWGHQPPTTNRHQPPTATNRQPPTASGDQPANRQPLPTATNHQLLTTNRHQPPTATNRQPPIATNRQPPIATDRQPPIASNRQSPPTANRQSPPTANRHQPPIATNRQPPIATNRQSRPTMVEHMSCTRSSCKTAVQEQFFMFFLLRTPLLVACLVRTSPHLHGLGVRLWSQWQAPLTMLCVLTCVALQLRASCGA